MNLKNSLVSNSLMIARYLADKNKKRAFICPFFVCDYTTATI